MVRPRQYVSKSPVRAARFEKIYGSRTTSFWKSLGRFLIGLALFIFDLAALVWLSCHVWNILCVDPYFSIEKIHVQGLKNFTEEEVIHRAQLNQVKNIFKLDMAETQRILSEEPLFKKVEVSKQLPNQIFVRVWEREPMAQIVSSEDPDHPWLLDCDGVVLTQSPGKNPLYPLIRMELHRNELRARNRMTQPALSKALKVLEIFSDSVLKKMFDLEYVDLSDPSDVVLKSVSGLTVHLGTDDFENRLIRLLSIFEDLKKKHQEPMTIDLRFRYVPVTLKEKG